MPISVILLQCIKENKLFHNPCKSHKSGPSIKEILTVSSRQKLLYVNMCYLTALFNVMVITGKIRKKKFGEDHGIGEKTLKMNFGTL